MNQITYPILLKVASLNILNDYCGSYSIKTSGTHASYFSIINKELYLTQPITATGVYNVSVVIFDPANRFVPKTQPYSLTITACPVDIVDPPPPTTTIGPTTTVGPTTTIEPTTTTAEPTPPPTTTPCPCEDVWLSCVSQCNGFCPEINVVPCPCGPGVLLLDCNCSDTPIGNPPCICDGGNGCDGTTTLPPTTTEPPIACYNLECSIMEPCPFGCVCQENGFCEFI